MRGLMRFMSGLIWGGMIGAGLGLILAPSSGEDLRRQMQERADRIQSEVQQAAANRRAELEHQLAEMREPRKPTAY